jgi:hypothetical protein
LEFFTVIWYILWPFCNVVLIFRHFGILCQEKSGNPDPHQHQLPTIEANLFCPISFARQPFSKLTLIFSAELQSRVLFANNVFEDKASPWKIPTSEMQKKVAPTDQETF